MESVMRRIVRVGSLLTVLLSAVSGAPGAFAQGNYRHHDWCLRTGGGLECGFSSLSECRAAGSGLTLAGCVRNTPAMNHQ